MKRYTILILVAGLMAQTTSRLKIEPTPAGPFSVAPYDAARHRQFNGFFNIPDVLRMRPYAVVLTNTSGRAIKALTVRWISMYAGDQQVTNYAADSFFLNPGNVLDNGDTLLMTPTSAISASALARTPRGPAGTMRDVFTAAGPGVNRSGTLSATLPPEPGVTFSSSGRSSPGRGVARSWGSDSLDTADQVRVSLDTVILDNGQVFGPDVSKTVESIQARWRAIDIVADATPEALAQYAANRAHYGPGNDQGTWVSRLAEQVQRGGLTVERLKATTKVKLHRDAPLLPNRP
jgi:hypothetical protein